MLAKKHYWKIRDKILITVIVSLFSLLLILVSLNAYNMNQQGQQAINSYRDDMIGEVREKLQNIVEIARDVANYYYQQSSSNPLAQEAAKEEAKTIISAMRYQNNEGYIWINDTSDPYPRMLMHPINPELNGQPLNDPKYNTAGTDNKNLFVAMKELALSQGFGYVPYMWPKPNAQGLQPKESYIAYFEPWDWVIGHGVYTDDIMARITEKNQQTTANAFSMSMSFIVITLILSLIIFTTIFIILNQLTKAVNVLVALSQKASQGDLSTNKEYEQVLTAQRNDEIGLLVNHFNSMMQNMRQSMGKTRETSEINLSEKDHLISAAEESAAASEEIQRNVKQISERSENLHHRSIDTAKSIIAISESIKNLKEQIHEQLSMVEESSASIIEMSSNIKNVADITKSKQISSENLIATVENGGRFIHSMADITGDLLSKMESINDMTHLINKISSQTNLLAMNAAIEASHAGESGKGFAVVADEIRKLAENSNVSSKQIQILIKEMVSIAKQAEASGQDSRAAFSQIKSDVQEVADAFSEITYSTAELTTGAMQIREAVTQLSTISNEVSAQYDEIDTTTNNVKSGCKDVMAITEYMRNALQEINMAVDLITESITGVRDISLKLDDISVQLNSEIAKYILN